MEDKRLWKWKWDVKNTPERLDQWQRREQSGNSLWEFIRIDLFLGVDTAGFAPRTSPTLSRRYFLPIYLFIHLRSIQEKFAFICCCRCLGRTMSGTGGGGMATPSFGSLLLEF